MATNEYPTLTIGTSLNGTGITYVSDNYKERLIYREYQDAKLIIDAGNTKQGMLNKIKKVIFNNPATIVIWANGDKTVMKCDGEKYDPEKGLAMAITKYLLGNNQGYYYDIFTKWLPKKNML